MSTKNEVPFEQFERAQNRCKVLIKAVPASLEYFYLNHDARPGFLHTRAAEGDDSKSEPSLASTGTCTLLLQDMRDWDKWFKKSDRPIWHPKEVGDDYDESLRQQRKKMAKAIIGKKTKKDGKLPIGNAFEAAWRIIGAASILGSGDKRVVKISELEGGKALEKDDWKGILIKQLAGFETHGDAKKNSDHAKGSVRIHPYPSCAYLTHLALRALEVAVDQGWIEPERKTGLEEEEILGAAEQKNKMQRWARQQIQHHLAIRNTSSLNYDHYDLFYAAIILAQSGDGHRGDATSVEDQILLQAAVDAFFEAQKPDGTWPLGRPIFHYKTDGDCYCNDYEALAAAVSCRHLWPYLANNMPGLLRALDRLWVTKIATGDKQTGFAWLSGIRPTITKPEAWVTASALHFAERFSRFLAEQIRISNFEFFGKAYAPYLDFNKKRPREPPSVLALRETFLDAKTPAQEAPEVPARDVWVTEVLANDILTPLHAQAPDIDAGGKFGSDARMSILLYGPPGTSKTEACKMMAKALGWPLLEIDPTHFIRDGLAAVQSQADHIFRRLALMEQTVVLLDEVDELVRERRDGEAMESRFLTTAMLPKLIEINEARRSLFVVATNHIENFDLAISRAGRFDAAIMMMPPAWDAKIGKTFVDEFGKKSQIDAITHVALAPLGEALSRAAEHLDDSVSRETFKEIVEAMTWAELVRLSKKFKNEWTDDQVIAAVVSMIPGLTMYQGREYAQDRGARGAVFREGVPFDEERPSKVDSKTRTEGASYDASTKVLKLPPEVAIGFEKRPTWRYVYALREIRAKNRY